MKEHSTRVWKMRHQVAQADERCSRNCRNSNASFFLLQQKEKDKKDMLTVFLEDRFELPRAPTDPEVILLGRQVHHAVRRAEGLKRRISH